MGEKLTRAQRSALERLNTVSGVGQFDGRSRRALHALQRHGLAEFDDARDAGWKMIVRWRITPAGRAALTKEGERG
jgi:hypothetical protein